VDSHAARALQFQSKRERRPAKLAAVIDDHAHRFIDADHLVANYAIHALHRGIVTRRPPARKWRNYARPLRSFPAVEQWVAPGSRRTTSREVPLDSGNSTPTKRVAGTHR
jgi:hypothetical protein